ncbi:MAG: DNA polymerase IV [Pseudomonadota bacterium]
MKTDLRTILHVDMDAFFASVEQRDNPDIAGLPVLVGGTGGRGVVAAASYEARKFGVRSAMPMREALARCPDAVCVKPRFDRYKAASNTIFEVFRSITPEVEGLSLDEAFLDVTASRALFGDGVRIARQIKQDILARTALHASVGVATNKLVAKIASDLDKPDGLTVIAPGEEAQRLAPLGVRVIPGIGPRAASELHRQRIETVGDLQSADGQLLNRVFGRYAERMRQRAHGVDTRAVVAARAEKSVSAETTFDEDIADTATLERIIGSLADRTATRLRNKQLVAGVIQVKIRRNDFQTFTRQIRVQPATDNTKSITTEAIALLRDWLADHPGQALRLLGVGTQQLSSDQQLDLFDASENQPREMDKAVDAVRERFAELGVSALRTARRLQDDESTG